jgi:glucoamylase
VQSSVERLEADYRQRFVLNRGKHEGILIGRFCGDGYYGGGICVMTSLALAEFYWGLAGLILDGDSLIANADNARFRLSAGVADTADRVAQAGRLAARGDAVLAALCTLAPQDGSLPEQFDQRSGAPASARNLAWSHAAFLRTVDLRLDIRARFPLLAN